MSDFEQQKSALLKAISTVGSQGDFAKKVGVSQAAVSKWLKNGRIPAERVVLAEIATDGKVLRHQLRPDLYSFNQAP